MSSLLIDQQQIAKSVFFYTFAATLVLKLFLASVTPLTGDEAFFNLWGTDPAWGYSDHPPMIGWWLSVLNMLGYQPIALRLMTALFANIVAILIVDMISRVLPKSQKSVAWWMASIYLVMPFSWVFVLVTTDTPLILFMALTVWSLVRAEISEDKSAVYFYVFSGFFLGLAFLSKYFAALLGIAFSFYILFSRRDRWWSLLLLSATALPFVFLNLVFNAYNGWPNILFNFINRHDQTQWQVESLFFYCLIFCYLFTPWLIWRGFKTSPIKSGSARVLLGYLWMLPLCFFLFIAVRRSVGLHWLLGFVPVFIVWVGLSIGGTAVPFRRYWLWTSGLAIPHFVFVLVLSLGPVSWWNGTKFYEKIVFLRESAEITDRIEQDLVQGEQIMALAYSPAAILAYHHRQYVPVFGVGRHHARQDDLSFNFKNLDGRPVSVFSHNQFDLDLYQPYFDNVKNSSFNLKGVTYYILKGDSFRYQAYRDQFLVHAAMKFYQLPNWLPVWGQPFCERYELNECSPQPNQIAN